MKIKKGASLTALFLLVEIFGKQKLGDNPFFGFCQQQGVYLFKAGFSQLFPAAE